MTEYQAKQTLLTNENKNKKYKQEPERTQNVTFHQYDPGYSVKQSIETNSNTDSDTTWD